MVTYLWIVPHIWRCTLGVESRFLYVEVSKKFFDLYEIEIESKWMLRNVSEMVGGFRKETLT